MSDLLDKSWYADCIIVAVKKLYDIALDKIEVMGDIRIGPGHDDYEYPCFKLAKLVNKDPDTIAEEINNEISHY